MPPTGAPDNLAYATALAAACQRILAAPDAAALWRTVVDEALALIAADGAAVVSYIEGFWQTLAVRASDSAPGDSPGADVIEILVRQGLFQRPFPNGDPAEVAARDALGEPAVLVARIEGSLRQQLRLVWYVTGSASLSPYAEVAEAIARHASQALEAARERDNLTRAMAARHRVGLAQGILMVRRQITADQAFAVLKRESQNTHVKLRTIAQTVIQTGDLPSARRVRSDGS